MKPKEKAQWQDCSAEILTLLYKREVIKVAQNECTLIEGSLSLGEEALKRDQISLFGPLNQFLDEVGYAILRKLKDNDNQPSIFLLQATHELLLALLPLSSPSPQLATARVRLGQFKASQNLSAYPFLNPPF